MVYRVLRSWAKGTTSVRGWLGTQTGAKLLGQTVTANPASVQTLSASVAKALARCLASVICVVYMV